MLESALKTLKIIEDNGFKAYIVGGFARNTYINKTSIDVDICTSATPKELKKIFENLIMSSFNYGSCKVVVDNITIDLTTMRIESDYLDNRRPNKIEYVTDLLVDLKRRDFIMNTLIIDSNNQFLDFLNAREDIDNKIISCVGDANKKIKEDSLRILRAIRFATQLDFNIDLELKKAIIKNKNSLKKLSYYRKKEELDKIFTSKNVLYGVALIKELELEDVLELNFDNFKVTTSIIGIWAQITDKYVFNKIETTQILKIKELLKKELNILNIYKYGLYVSSVVGEIKGINKEYVAKIVTNLPIRKKEDIDITYNDLKKMNIDYKKTLKLLEEKIVLNKLENKKEEIIKYLNEVKV